MVIASVTDCPQGCGRASEYLGQVSWYIPFEKNGYVDAKGARHIHNPNKQFEEWKCKNGHHVERSYFVPCRCGWVADEQSS